MFDTKFKFLLLEDLLHRFFAIVCIQCRLPDFCGAQLDEVSSIERLNRKL